MTGKIISNIIFILTICCLMIAITLFFESKTVYENVNEINYNVAEVVSTTGILTSNIYDELLHNINKYGDFYILLKYQKHISPGVYDTYYDKNDIIDCYMEVEDKLSICLINRESSLFNRFMASAMPFWKPETPQYETEGIVYSYKTAYIANSKKDLVKGYDVIVDIKNKASDGEFTTSGIAILVKTKLNSLGKYYGQAGHPDITTTNVLYGDTVDELGNTGANYIFDNGDFVKETELYANGMIKLIVYTQQ